jgi:Pyruvate phosphate dikinase, AMP/ATP-binding domain
MNVDRDPAPVHPAEVVMSNVVWFADLGLADLEQVGGKNASLGEMIANLSSAGVRVPDGFATTAEAYRLGIESMSLNPDTVVDTWISLAERSAES